MNTPPGKVCVAFKASASSDKVVLMTSVHSEGVIQAQIQNMSGCGREPAAILRRSGLSQ